MSYQHYSDFFKASVISEARKRLIPQKQIAQQFGIPEATLSRWMNNRKQQKAFVEPLFTKKPEKKQYSEMSFDELLNHLPSRENKSFASYLHEQYMDKGIALRYCLVVLNPSTEKVTDFN